MAGQGTPASGANCAGRMRVCGGGDSGSCAEWGLLLSGEARLSLGITLVSNTFARIALQLALIRSSLTPRGRLLTTRLPSASQSDFMRLCWGREGSIVC